MNDPRIPVSPREAAKRLRWIAHGLRRGVDDQLAALIGPCGFADVELEDIAFGLELHARLQHARELDEAWRAVQDDTTGGA